MGLLACSLLFASAAFAGVPSLSLSTATTAATADVSVYTLPNGAGHPLNDCQLFGGSRTDATISLHLVDGNGDPIFLYPFEDIALATELGGLVACPGGAVSDQSTDVNGDTTFSGALFAGGYSDYAGGEGCVVLINGDALLQPALPVYFNSPDMTGDRTVNLSDISEFAGAYYGTYNYGADFYWDGTLNLSDIASLAQGNGATCP